MRKAMEAAKAREAPPAEPVDERIAGVLRQVEEMARTLSAEAYLRRVEDLADSARRYLRTIPDPQMRQDLRQLYRQVISYALDLKMPGA
jgi:hypothetical protein